MIYVVFALCMCHSCSVQFVIRSFSNVFRSDLCVCFRFSFWSFLYDKVGMCMKRPLNSENCVTHTNLCMRVGPRTSAIGHMNYRVCICERDIIYSWQNLDSTGSIVNSFKKWTVYLIVWQKFSDLLLLTLLITSLLYEGSIAISKTQQKKIK